MKKESYFKYWISFLVIQIIFVQIISKFPDVVEQYYSNEIYVYVSSFFRISLGCIPFSVGDFLYFFLILFVFYLVYNFFKSWFFEAKKKILDIVIFVSLGYFLFHFNWGLNYYRIPLAKRLEITSNSYTPEDLLRYADSLIKNINTLHKKITKNDSTKVVSPYSSKEIYDKATEGYSEIAKKHPFLKYKYSSIKNSIISLPLSYMGFAGYLNPFTGEAHINNKIPKNSFPFTICHEMAHQLGYAAENEANFIGYLASVSNKNLYFKYSGKIIATRYILSEIYKYDENLFIEYKKKLNLGIIENIKESQNFWKQYKNPFEFIFKKSYNAYLKANKQKKGIKSYNYMVNLLLNYEAKSTKSKTNS